MPTESEVNMTDQHECTIESDANGEFVKLQYELIQQLGWNQYTVLDMKLSGNNIQLTKKTEWTVAELQEGDTFDKVMDDVVHNQQVHFIIHEDKKYVLRPITENDKELLG